MTAGYLLLASAALHVIGSVLSGFTPVGLFMLFPAVLYTGFVIGLRRGLGWVVWVALVCMLGGMAGTAIELAKPSSVPGWVLWGVLAADLLAAIFLCRMAWRQVTASKS